MNYLHYEFDLGENDALKVTLDGRANVKMLDNNNYEKYKAGSAYRYIGGLAEEAPLVLSPPRPGHWHVVIDLGGFPGTVGAAVRQLSRAS